MNNYGTILIVDDNPAILTALRLCLDTTFEHIVTLERPDDILKTLAQEAVDLILLDMNFTLGVNSGSEGLLWLRTIRKHHPQLPVVLLTAFSQPEFVKRATDAGVQAYLVKPVQEANLFPAIEVAMSRYQDMQGLEDELFKVKDTLEMRKLLDRAKGILMDAHNISESEAFNRIQKYSMAKRKTIKEVAEAIIRAATK